MVGFFVANITKKTIRIGKKQQKFGFPLTYLLLSSKENLILYLDWLIVSRFYLNLHELMINK